jgi:hypothetical protein
MRIAYCLCGIVGASNFGMGLGKDIDYRLAHYFNKKNIFDVNDKVDVFMHSWSVNHQEGLEKIYEPKGSLFEKQIDFGQPTIRDNAIASRWYSTAMCNQLRKEYQTKNNVSYDVVMFFRFDHIFLKPLNFDEFDLDSIWFRHRRPYGWTDGVREADNKVNDIDTEKYQDLSTRESRRKLNLHPNDRVYDSFVFSNPHNIDKYASVYEYLVNENPNINSPHAEIPNHLKRQGVWDKVDFTFFGEIDTEAIRALYRNPELTSGEFNIDKFERFPEKYVRQNTEVIKRFKFTDSNQINDLELNNSGFKNGLRVQ